MGDTLLNHFGETVYLIGRIPGGSERVFDLVARKPREKLRDPSNIGAGNVPADPLREWPAMACFKVLPSRHSMAINALPFSSLMSCMVQMFGWSAPTLPAPPSGIVRAPARTCHIVREDLRCHVAAQPGVLGLIDHTHPADLVMRNAKRKCSQPERALQASYLLGLFSLVSTPVRVRLSRSVRVG